MKTLNALREQVIATGKSSPKRIAVAAAGDTEVLETVRMLNESGLGTALLIGDKAKIQECARQTGCDLSLNEIVDQPDNQKAAAMAVDAVKSRKAQIVMKGLLLTPVYLKEILNSTTGIKAGKLVHLVTVMEIPHVNRLLLASDMGMVIQPTLEEKAEMIRNIAYAFGKLGNPLPKVACLGAIETVSEKMADTNESAILSKMAERGQIRNAIVDGPLSFDLACFPEALEHKKVESQVAGKADAILFPNLQAGNIFYKAMIHAAGAKSGTVIMGTSAPAVMTSRSDTAETKLNSIALALALAD